MRFAKVRLDFIFGMLESSYFFFGARIASYHFSSQKGALSITEISARRATKFVITSSPTSLWESWRPLKITQTCTLSPSSKNSRALRALVSTSCSPMTGLSWICFRSDFFVGELATFEDHTDLHFVTIFQELTGFARFGLNIMFPNDGAKLDLLPI